jgi:hypothetical protein
MCKLKNIETIMFITTQFNWNIYPIHRFEQGSEAIRLAYKQAILKQGDGPVELSKSMTEYFEHVTGSYNKVVAVHLLDQVDEVYNLLSGKRSLVPKVKDKIKFVIDKINIKDMLHRWQFLTSKLGTVFVSDQKERSKSFQAS